MRWASRGVLCALVLLMISSAYCFATDETYATVQAMGQAWLNGAQIPRVSAIFPGDEIQTKTDLANIDAFGSKVLILTDSLVTYQQNAMEVERGGISVATSKGVAAQLGNLVIRPTGLVWTEFRVVEANGLAHIQASQGELALVDENGTTNLAPGEETTREVKQKHRKRSAGAPPSGIGSVMDSKTALVVGGAVIGGVLMPWVVLPDDDPISPDKP